MWGKSPQDGTSNIGTAKQAKSALKMHAKWKSRLYEAERVNKPAQICISEGEELPYWARRNKVYTAETARQFQFAR